MESSLETLWLIYAGSALISAGIWTFLLSHPVAKAILNGEYPDDRFWMFASTIIIFFPLINTLFVLLCAHSWASKR